MQEENKEIELCFNCKKEFHRSCSQIFSCGHPICYICICRKIIIDELSPLENTRSITVECFCHKGNQNFTYENFNNFLTESFAYPVRVPAKEKCAQHNEINVTSYCKKCKIEICDRCLPLHRPKEGHEVISLEDYFKTRNVRKPNLIFGGYGDFCSFVDNLQIKFESYATDEKLKKMALLHEMIEKLNETERKYATQVEETKNLTKEMFISIKKVYEIFYKDLNDPTLDVIKYKMLKKLKKDFRDMEFINEDTSELQKINMILKEYEEKNHLQFKFQFFHFNFKNTDTLLGHTESVLSLSQTENGLLASGSEDQYINLWNVLSKNENNFYSRITTLKGHRDKVFSLLSGKENTLFSGGRDDKIIKWDVNLYEDNQNNMNDKSKIITYYPNGYTSKKVYRSKETTQFQPLDIIYSNSIHVYSLINLSDGNFAFGGRDETIKIYDSHFNNCINTLRGHENTVFSVIELFPGILISGSADATIRSWNVKNKKFLYTYMEKDKDELKMKKQQEKENKKHYLTDKKKPLKEKKVEKDPKELGLLDEVYCLVKLERYPGKFASGSNDSFIRIFSVPQDGKMITMEKKLSGHLNSITSLIQLNDYRLVSGSCDGNIKLWDLRDMTCTQTLTGHVNTVFALFQLKDGRLVSGSADKTIKIWG